MCLKEKPVLSGIKSAVVNDKKVTNVDNFVAKPNQIVRVQSESDLIIKIEQENAVESERKEEDMKVCVKVEGNNTFSKHNKNKQKIPSKQSKTDCVKEAEENLVSADILNDKGTEREEGRSSDVGEVTQVKGKKTQLQVLNSSKTTSIMYEGELLPSPPPSPEQSDPIVIPSTPLTITTEPMSVSTNSEGVRTSVDDKSNCSTSFDSLDGSLDSAGWSPDWTSSPGVRSSSPGVKSPAGSICSKAPPSPSGCIQPTRQV